VEEEACCGINMIIVRESFYKIIKEEISGSIDGLLNLR